MNTQEQSMLDMLTRGREEFGVVAVKAEFEAEGTRPDELLRLLELTWRSGLNLALKIGGCEAISDLLAARLYGASYIIAPMVETPYALSKFVDARAKVWGEDAGRAKFLYNLETVTTLANLDEMIPVAKDGGLDGIVFGRVDFTQSAGLTRAEINGSQICQPILRTAHACAEHDLELVVGGGVSVDAQDALRSFRDIRLYRFETRKVVFDGAMAHAPRYADAIANAVAFELAWLENKRAYYSAIAEEDSARIAMMQQRGTIAAKAPMSSMAA